MKKKIIIKSRGFSLLEILIVLVFIGIILAAATRYAGKVIDEKARQTAADAVAQEVYGVLQFVNADSITASVDNKTKNIINPLYQQPWDAISDSTGDDKTLGLRMNPVWLIHPHTGGLDPKSTAVSPYIARTWSKGITFPVSNQITASDNGNTYYSHSLKWSQAVWGQNSVRSYFTDSGCKGATGHVYFNQQFLSCNENPALSNSEIAVPRIDFVSNQGTTDRYLTATPERTVSVAIDRVDVYISFMPVDGNSARIEQFITPLLTAFRAKKIIPDTDSIYLVRQAGAGGDNSWTLLNKTTGLPADKNAKAAELAVISDLPSLIGKLQKKQTYGVRFSFDGKRGYLRTDGLNAADKICWNTTTSSAGPCLTSPSQSSLILTKRNNPGELADLQAGSVISQARYLRGGKMQTEYYTAPRIQYAAFSNTGSIPLYYRNPDPEHPVLCTTGGCGAGVTGPTVPQVTDPANGAISIPVQSCPDFVVDTVKDGSVKTKENGSVIMYPRLSASVSSVISGLRKDPSGRILPAQEGVFSSQKKNMSLLSGHDSDITLNRLGGVTLQIIKDKDSDTWRIAGMVATEDANPQDSGTGHLWQYYNPPWLSLVVTTWCSSVDQP
ncbi:type II secretion system protein [Salmonella enterica]|uniref:Type II secretion system protein n=1 Tax=Salmonella diarizonae TaxID=59204 RepID=A0A5Y1YF61_SALDZ|nr:type II secretion system protein [Salmonella enterica]ECB2072190.1 type II secretion system protein [Salmonella enterica subsp. enterica serovar Benin]ECC3917332.1 type II secretion system protein [Salmonella enterica subsp. diarizonae]EBE6988913.1 type II secretion system protein [Salmonella enterica]EBE7299531.1 type II secretion system protein [Salmonella enterica]